MSQNHRPYISVIICTYNRSNNLKTLLDCLLIQEVAEDCTYEIIVVDNNSHDNTKELVESLVPKFQGRLRYLFEPRQGKPYALNDGIREAQGEILVFTDDDCLLEKDHIEQINKIFQDYGSSIDFIGGKIFPYWVGGDCPPWLSEALADKTAYPSNNALYWRRMFFRGPLAILDCGDEPFRVDITQQNYEWHLFYGPNMAVRKSALDTIGGYALERNITQDTEICLRLIRAGMKGLYTPNVKVFHRVEAERITPAFYRQWYFQRGKYLEVSNKYQPKFYHPFGIQITWIIKTLKLFIKSIFARSYIEKMYLRCEGIFNLGQMVQVVNKNIV